MGMFYTRAWLERRENPLPLNRRQHSKMGKSGRADAIGGPRSGDLQGALALPSPLQGARPLIAKPMPRAAGASF